MQPPRSIHLSYTHVRAAEDRSSIEAVSAYIKDEVGRETKRPEPVEAALAYLRATGRHKEQDSRVVATEFICRGSLDRDRAWRELDRSFLTKAGAYSCRGGNKRRRGQDFKSSGRARLAVFGDATLPRDIAEEAKLEIGRKFGRALVDRYGCAVELAWHAKDGRIDHFHMLISTKPVDEGGVGTRCIRELNGIATRCGEVRADDGARIASFAEFSRQTYANLLSGATGTLYDPRSLRRQGRSDQPVPWVPRKVLEDEARNGTLTSMVERKRLLVSRAAQHAAADTLVIKPERVSTAAHVVPAPTDVATTMPHSLLTHALGGVVRSDIPVLNQRTASRDVGKAISEARTAEDVAKVIAASVDVDLKDDAIAFAREQNLAESKRRVHRLDGLPAPETSWFGAARKKSPEEFTLRLRRRTPHVAPV